jgi:hypothetical protein
VCMSRGWVFIRGCKGHPCVYGLCVCGKGVGGGGCLPTRPSGVLLVMHLDTHGSALDTTPCCGPPPSSSLTPVNTPACKPNHPRPHPVASHPLAHTPVQALWPRTATISTLDGSPVDVAMDPITSLFSVTINGRYRNANLKGAFRAAGGAGGAGAGAAGGGSGVAVAAH